MCKFPDIVEILQGFKRIQNFPYAAHKAKFSTPVALRLKSDMIFLIVIFDNITVSKLYYKWQRVSLNKMPGLVVRSVIID